MLEKHYTLTTVARALGVNFWNIYYALECGAVPRPTKKNGRYCWDDAAVEALRKHFAERPRWERLEEHVTA